MRTLKRALAGAVAALICVFALAQPVAAGSMTAYYSGYQMWGCSSRYYYDDGVYRGTLYKVDQVSIGDGVNYYCYYMGEVYTY